MKTKIKNFFLNKFYYFNLIIKIKIINFNFNKIKLIFVFPQNRTASNGSPIKKHILFHGTGNTFCELFLQYEEYDHGRDGAEENAHHQHTIVGGISG